MTCHSEACPAMGLQQRLFVLTRLERGRKATAELWSAFAVALRRTGYQPFEENPGLGAAIGFAIASVARNTAAALGVGFGYTIVVENLVRGLRPHWTRWLLGDNAVVFITRTSDGMPFHRSAVWAGVLLAVYAGALVVAALFVFRARDVT